MKTKTAKNPKGAGRNKNPEPTVLIRRMIPKFLADRKPSGKLIAELLTKFYETKDLK